MKGLLVFICSLTFTIVFFGLLTVLDGPGLNELGMVVVPVSAGIWMTSTLLFINRAINNP